jgi:hypothetical protein
MQEGYDTMQVCLNGHKDHRLGGYQPGGNPEILFDLRRQDDHELPRLRNEH